MTAPWSSLYAFDARSGKQLWKVDPKAPREIAATSICCNISNRGAAYADGKIIWGTIDGRLMAVNAKTGQKVWEARVADPKLQYSITGAPRIGDGLVFIGVGGGEFYTRGYLVAYDVKTGKLVWKFYTVPGDPAKGPDGAASDNVMPMAAKTWNGKWWEKGGGGSTWDGIVYDPKSDLVIFGTGNGLPWPAALRSPGGGDNLFTSSIVAVHAKTGKYKWHYQATPMDGFDFDNTAPLTLADITVDGQPKHVVMQAPKNGVFYVIEAATGKVVSADPYVPKINWALGFDKANNWAPILNPEANYGKTGKGFWMLPSQAHVWYPQSFNPQTGLIYVAGAPRRGFVLRRGRGPHPGQPDGGCRHGPSAGRQAARGREPRRLPAGLGSGGPQGGLGAARRQRQCRHAHDRRQPGVPGACPGRSSRRSAPTPAQKVWAIDTQGNVVPGPVTYTLDGVQYIAVISSASTGFAAAAGKNRLLVYKLNGDVQLPPAAAGTAAGAQPAAGLRRCGDARARPGPLSAQLRRLPRGWAHIQRLPGPQLHGRAQRPGSVQGHRGRWRARRERHDLVQELTEGGGCGGDPLLPHRARERAQAPPAEVRAGWPWRPASGGWSAARYRWSAACAGRAPVGAIFCGIPWDGQEVDLLTLEDLRARDPNPLGHDLVGSRPRWPRSGLSPGRCVCNPSPDRSVGTNVRDRARTMSAYGSEQLLMAARATASEVDPGWSSRGMAVRTHSSQALRVASSSLAACCAVSSVCGGVAALASPHRAAVATSATISSIRFLRFMVAPSRVRRRVLRAGPRRVYHWPIQHPVWR